MLLLSLLLIATAAGEAELSEEAKLSSAEALLPAAITGLPAAEDRIMTTAAGFSATEAELVEAETRLKAVEAGFSSLAAAEV